MTLLLPDILRALVSSILSVFLMLSLLQPKYSKKITNILILSIVVINMTFAILSYVFGDLRLVVKVDILVFTILFFVLRPFFLDSFMQWLFSYITVLNIRMCILVLSFSIGNFLPYSMYAITLVRLILGLIIIYILGKYIQPLYRGVVKYWHIFFQVALAIFITFLYYLFSGEEITTNLTNQAVPLHLLVLITLVAYIALFHSIKIIFSEYQLKKENLQMKNAQELLYLSTDAMKDKLDLLNEIQEKCNIANHDRRHFNNTLLELLSNGKIDESLELLQKRAVVHPLTMRKYCENSVINAAISYYIDLAEESKIKTEISLEIPSSLPVDSLELALVISNLLENAIHACRKIKNENEKKITFTSRHVGHLILEITNSYIGSASIINEDGYPVREDGSIGIGTKSILAFTDKNNSEILYKIDNDKFRVRMII